MKLSNYKKRYKDKTLPELVDLQKSLMNGRNIPADSLTAVLQLMEEANPVEAPESEDPKTASSTHPDYALAKQYINKAMSCTKRGIDFQLSLNEYKAIKNKKSCFYTGIKFDDTHLNKLTIDRIDNKLGYTKDNSVACCQQVNALKNTLFECENRPTTINAKQLRRLADKLVKCGIK